MIVAKSIASHGNDATTAETDRRSPTSNVGKPAQKTLSVLELNGPACWNTPVPEVQTKPILALVRDLMFASKISATGRAHGVSVEVIRDPDKLPGREAAMLIVDLNQDAALPAAIEWKRQGGGWVVGFVSHVDGATIREARAGGLDQVLPRSEFVRTLAELLQRAG